jgi:hypothetical protein
MPSRALALSLLLGAATLAAPAPADSGRRLASDFHRIAPVEGPVSPGEAYAVPLSRDAVAALKRGGELRLFDAAGVEIPSLVFTAEERGEVIERPTRVFDRAWRDDGSQTLSVELTDRKPQPVNEFVFDIAQEDYNLRARVEARRDDGEWLIVADGLHLIRHTVPEQKIRYVHDVLRVPTARFRVYRFTLEPTLPPRPGEAFEPLEIAGVKVRQVVRRGSALDVPVRLERYEDARDPNPRHQHWKLHLPGADLGIDRVALTIPADDFARPASLWEWSGERGRRTRQLASTVLFHYGSDVQTSFSGFTSDASVLVVQIDQGDDEPVTPASARASRPRQQLRFVAPAGTALPLALHFDPDRPREPRYDLERRLREHEITRFTELAHRPLVANPGYTAPPPPRSEQVPWLLYAAVVPLVLGLGWYVARTVQRGVPEESPPGDA